MDRFLKRINDRIKKYIVNPILILYIKIRRNSIGINYDEIREKKIIVSLTSFPARFPTLPICLKSLLLQNYKPDKIIVWLDSSAMSEITNEMLEFKKFGVEYRVVDEDIKSHKKYYYAMKKFTEDLIITVDDDLIYPPNMIKSLIKMHKLYPNAICARRVHKINTDSNGNIMDYYNWEKECTQIKKPSHNLIATTGSGTLFFPHCLDNRAFEIDNIKKYCFSADDIWIKFMAYLNNTPIVWVPCLMMLPPLIKNSQTYALYKSNVNEKKNDNCIKNMVKKYKINCDDLTK